MEENKQNLIKKLRNTYNLWNETKKAKKQREQLNITEDAEIKGLFNRTNSKIKETVDKEEEKISSRPLLPKEFLTPPPQKPETPDCKTERDVMMTGVHGLLVYVAILFWLSLFLINKLIQENQIVMFIEVAILIALILPWLTKSRKRANVLNYDKDCKEYEKKLEEWENQLDSAINEEVIEGYLDRCCDFDASFVSFLRDTDAQIKNIINEKNESMHSIHLDYSNRKKEADEYIQKTENELESIGVLTVKYYYLAWAVADVLEDGRADSLKEALNIAIEDERREQESQERREEAQRQQEILERQAQEARRHNAEMERNAKEQAEAARKAYEETARHNKETERQQNKRYGNSICLSCANYAGKGGRCNGEFVKRTGSCGSFRS